MSGAGDQSAVARNFRVAAHQAGGAGVSSRNLTRPVARCLANLALAGWVFFGAGALAAPPPGADPESATGRWVRSLKNAWGVSCCDEADCRPAQMRFTDAGGVEVFIDDRFPGSTHQWEPVSEEVIRTTRSDGPAPNAGTWACFYAGRVNCFVMGGGI